MSGNVKIPPSRTIRPDHFRWKNSKVISPSDNAQTAYDWLKSSDRDTEMGALSSTNPRYLVRSPGVYTGNLTLETNYVYVVDLKKGTVIDNGTHTLTAALTMQPFFGLGEDQPKQPYQTRRVNHTGAFQQIFDAATGCTAVNVNGYASCTLANDTTNWRASGNAIGSGQSVSMTVLNSNSKASWGIMKLNSPANGAEINLSALPGILLRLFIPTGTGDSSYEYIDQIKMTLYKDGLAYSDTYTVWEAFDTNTWSGTHKGANDSTTLYDTTYTWKTDQLVGCSIVNSTDGSYGIITANDSHTITIGGGMQGGVGNDWDTNDAYTIYNYRRCGMSGWNEWNTNLFSYSNSTTIANFDLSSVELIYLSIYTRENKIEFTNGSAAVCPLVGQTLTGGTSSKTCVIQKVVVTSGSWAGGNAAGYYLVKTISGAFTAGETITASTSNATATLGTVTYRTPSVSFDELMFYPKATTPYTILRFDDIYDEHYEAAAYLHSKGLKGCFGVIGSMVGTGSGQSLKLTLDELKAMQAMGHLLVNHSWTADDVTDISPAQMDYYIRKNAQWMQDNGLGAGSRIFIYPEGIWQLANETLSKDFLDVQWRSFRTPGYYGIPQLKDVRKIGGVMIDASAGTLALFGYNCRASGTLANCLASVITEGGIYCPYTHYIGETSYISWADFMTHMAAIATEVDAGTIKNVTPLDLLNGV